jgi:uncharacterized membrane protein
MRWTAFSPVPVNSLPGFRPIDLALFAILTISGVAGSLFDSLLGATLQAIFYCPTCGKETEQHPLHTCETPTHLVRGLPWLNNDLVNVACTLFAALAAIILLAILNLL